MMPLFHPQALALVIPGQDWLYQFVNNLTTLTTTNGGALTSLGLSMLSFIALMMLVNMVITYSTANMSFSLNPVPLEGGVIIQFLLRLAVCCLLETYWINPVPGTGISLNHLFSTLAQAIVSALDQNSLQNFNQLLTDAGSQMGAPGMFSIPEQACYWLVQICFLSPDRQSSAPSRNLYIAAIRPFVATITSMPVIADGAPVAPKDQRIRAASGISSTSPMRLKLNSG